MLEEIAGYVEELAEEIQDPRTTPAMRGVIVEEMHGIAEHLREIVRESGYLVAPRMLGDC